MKLLILLSYNSIISALITPFSMKNGTFNKQKDAQTAKFISH